MTGFVGVGGLLVGFATLVVYAIANLICVLQDEHIGSRVGHLVLLSCASWGACALARVLF